MERYNKMLKERINELLEKTEDTLLLEEVFCRLKNDVPNRLEGKQSFHIGAHPKHYGFGQWHTGREWARIADIPYNTFRRYLGKGMTVKEIFKFKNCLPPSDT